MPREGYKDKDISLRRRRGILKSSLCGNQILLMSSLKSHVTVVVIPQLIQVRRSKTPLEID